MKKVIAGILVLCMCFAVFACSKEKDGDEGSSGAPVKDTLTMSITGDRGTLDPNGLLGGSEYLDAIRMVSEPLFDFKANGEKVWKLAVGIDEPSPTQWVIHLRKDVVFSNGNKFTAEDVMFTFDRANNTPGSPPFYPVLDLDNSRIIDDYTVELNFFEYDLSSMPNIPTMLIYDAESFDEDANSQNPIGTGPYVVSDYVVGSHLHMKARDDYWGDKPKIENLQFKVLNEDSQRINALEIGSVDIATIPNQDIDYVKTLDGLDVILRPTGSTMAVWFNISELSIFDDVIARYAVCHAIDRDAIIDLVYNGYASLTYWPNAMNLSDYEERYANVHPIYSVGYDTDLAVQYAEQSGLVGKDVIIATDGSPNNITIAELIQQNLRDIGINAIINNYDAASYYDVTNDPSLFDIRLGMVFPPSRNSAQNFYGWVFWTLLNRGGWLNFDRYMELAGGVMGIYDDAERSDVIFELNKMHSEAALWFALCDLQSAIGASSDIRGIEQMALGNIYYSDLYWAQ